MKQILILIVAVCFTATVMEVIALNVNFATQSYDFSDIALANIEALASNEDGSECKCGCYGPKVPNSNNTFAYCKCENGKCCCDDSGCNLYSLCLFHR